MVYENGQGSARLDRTSSQTGTRRRFQRTTWSYSGCPRGRGHSAPSTGRRRRGTLAPRPRSRGWRGGDEVAEAIEASEGDWFVEELLDLLVSHDDLDLRALAATALGYKQGPGRKRPCRRTGSAGLPREIHPLAALTLRFTAEVRKRATTLRPSSSEPRRELHLRPARRAAPGARTGACRWSWVSAEVADHASQAGRSSPAPVGDRERPDRNAPGGRG